MEKFCKQLLSIEFEIVTALCFKVSDTLLNVSFSHKGKSVKILLFYLKDYIDYNSVTLFSNDLKNKLEQYDVEISILEITYNEFYEYDYKILEIPVFSRSRQTSF
jgi:hypothetical protein